MKKPLLPILALLALLALPPRGEAGSSWTVGRPIPHEHQLSMDRIPHRLWERLLHKYVDPQGNVDYAAWKRSPQGVQH